MNKMQGATLLKYKNYRYFKATSLLMALAITAYVLIRPAGGESYGGTWLGYVLGILSTLIMVFLMWYGITKRRISGAPERRQQRIRTTRSDEMAAQLKFERRKTRRKTRGLSGATLQEWLSAHVYLGASLIVLVSLHTGFHFGMNVHTLAYVLMLLVITSGFYGLNVYLNYPRLITLNMAEDTLDDLLLKIAELDELACTRALGLPDEVNALVLKARHETRIGGTLFQQLSGEQRDCPTRHAVQQMLHLGEKYNQDDQPKIMRDLYSALLRKEKLVLRARTEIMLKARLECWLYLHAPLGIALLAALTAHIVSIFFYW
ncbi:MAG: hypothetical protein Q7T38_09925 [Gallionella sp.]|nr:hypothetical protein [Gallionella sp.]